MRRDARWISIVSALAVLTVVYFAMREKPTNPFATHEATLPAVPKTQNAYGAAQPEPGPAAATQTVASMKEKFAHADDYLVFARAVHGSAQNGNADAQYYLGEALRYCAVGYRMYYQTREATRRTLEEAVRRADSMVPGLSPDEARLIHERCHALMDGNPQQFGTADEWRETSAAAGQPLAQIDLAIDHLIQARIYPNYPNLDKPIDPRPLQQSSRALMSKAIKSKDPEVIWKMGDIQGWLEGIRAQWVWRVAACQKGKDCSATAEWHTFECRLDPRCPPGESGMDYIQRNVPDGEYDSIVQEAIELNADIDSGQWSKIGIANPAESKGT